MPDDTPFYWSDRTLLDVQAERKEQEGTGLIDVVTGAMKWDTVGGFLYREASAPEFKPTTFDFDPETLMPDDVTDLYSADAVSKMRTSTSPEEFQYIQDQYNEEVLYMQNVQKEGLSGMAAMMVTATLGDPSTYIGAGLGWAGKGERLARAIKTGLVTGTINATNEALLAVGSDVKDEEDVAYAFIGGLVLGGGVAGILPTKVSQAGMDHLTPENKAIFAEKLEANKRAMQATLDRELSGKVAEGDLSVQEAIRLQAEYYKPDPKGSVGAMQRMEGIYKKYGIYLQADNEAASWGVSTGATLSRSKNGEYQNIADAILEQAGGKKAGATSTAAIRRDMYAAQLNESHPAYRDAFKEWADAEGINLFKKNFSLDTSNKFNQDVRAELIERQWDRARSYDGRSTGVEAAVKKAADAHDAATKLQAELQAKSGIAPELRAKSGYFQRRWSSSRIWKIADMFEREGLGGRETMEAWINTGLKKAVVNLGMETDDAVLTDIARSISNRFLEQARGGDTNKLMTLNADSREFILKTLDPDLDPARRAAIEKFLAGEHMEKSKAGHLKQATLIDLSAEIELPDGRKLALSELLEGDIQRNLASQNRRVAGNTALAEAGYKSDTDWNNALLSAQSSTMDNWRELGYKNKQAALEASEHETKLLQFSKKQLQGEPLFENDGGMWAKFIAHTKDMTALTSLGAMGIPQLAETHRIIAQVGIMNTIKGLPALKNLFDSVRNGKAPDAMIADLEASFGFRIGKDYERNPFILRDEWGGQTAAGAAGEQSQKGFLYEKTMHNFKTGLAYASGHRFIQEAQHLMQMRAMGKKFQTMALNPSDINYKRMADIGLDKSMLNRVLKQVQSKTEKYGMDSLHTERWPADVREPFLEALHRANTIAIQRQLIGETATWMHSHMGEILTQFRSFPIVAMEKQSAREFRMRDKETAMVFMYGSAIGSAMYASKLALNTVGMSGRDRDKYMDEMMTPGRIASGCTEMLGVFSVAPDMYAQVQSVFGIPNAFEGRGAMSQQKFNPVNAVPAVGKLVSAGGALADVARLWDADEPWTQSKHKNLFRAIPLGNTHAMKSLMNLTAPNK